MLQKNNASFLSDSGPEINPLTLHIIWYEGIFLGKVRISWGYLYGKEFQQWPISLQGNHQDSQLVQRVESLSQNSALEELNQTSKTIFWLPELLF